MAYEARRQWPGAKMHVTNEIIHNPAVNRRLQEMDISIIQDVKGKGKDFSGVQPSDVVILPAFGASVQEMKLLSDRGVQIVDTTCPWVAKVWNAVDGQARKEHTSVIHGKYSHEETVATASFAGTYLIVRDLEEARYVCDYITKGGDRAEFLAKFSKAVSQGFDPDRDLEKIGLATQTTMLRDETLEIGKMLERAQLQRHGAERLKDTYMVMDTICDATQERQDAVHSLVDARPDMVLVVGGFNSSNTSHLQEIPEGEGVGRRGPVRRRRHQLDHAQDRGRGDEDDLPLAAHRREALHSRRDERGIDPGQGRGGGARGGVQDRRPRV